MKKKIKRKTHFFSAFLSVSVFNTAPYGKNGFFLNGILITSFFIFQKEENRNVHHRKKNNDKKLIGDRWVEFTIRIGKRLNFSTFYLDKITHIFV
jgi:hypothetical protein